eukprot:365303-Chlamydomonas_euryale.AAC.31
MGCSADCSCHPEAHMQNMCGFSAPPDHHRRAAAIGAAVALASPFPGLGTGALVRVGFATAVGVDGASGGAPLSLLSPGTRPLAMSARMLAARSRCWLSSASHVARSAMPACADTWVSTHMRMLAVTPPVDMLMQFACECGSVRYAWRI